MKPTKTTRKGNKTRALIFEAAIKEFAENGYAGSRVENIAREAGINKQRIYAYFGDKEGLFIKVWERTAHLIEEEDRGFLNLDVNDVANLGEIILKRYTAFHDKNPEFWKIFVAENLFGGGHGRRQDQDGPDTGAEKPYSNLRRLYNLGQEQGIYSPDISFETFIFTLTAVTFFYASNRHTMSDTLQVNLNSPDVREKLLTEINTMLFGWKNRK